MKTKTGLLAAVIAGVTLLGVGESTIEPAEAAGSSARFYAIAPESGALHELAGATSLAKSIGAYGNNFCDPSDVPGNYQLKKYRTIAGSGYPAGNTNMRCGDQSYGWRHIKAAHQSQWERAISIADDDWGDLADFAIGESLRAPWIAVTEPGGKTCYSTPIHIYSDPGNELIVRFFVMTIVSQANRHVITAYPNSVENCHPV